MDLDSSRFARCDKHDQWQMPAASTLPAKLSHPFELDQRDISTFPRSKAADRDTCKLPESGKKNPKRNSNYRL